MDHPFIYRQGSIDDLNQLLDLAFISYSEYKEVLTPENWSKLQAGLRNEERLAGLITKSKVFICEVNKEIIGMAYLVPAGNPTHIFNATWCYIRMVGVNPKYRGHGIGATLTRQCIEHARATHEKVIALHTSDFMPGARHMYETLGFKKMREIEPIFDKRYWLYVLNLNDKESA